MWPTALYINTFFISACQFFSLYVYFWGFLPIFGKASEEWQETSRREILGGGSAVLGPCGHLDPYVAGMLPFEPHFIVNSFIRLSTPQMLFLQQQVIDSHFHWNHTTNLKMFCARTLMITRWRHFHTAHTVELYYPVEHKSPPPCPSLMLTVTA